MNNIILPKLIALLLAVTLILPSVAFAAVENVPANIDLQDLALPSDMKELAKQSGSVYYSSTSKNKPLMPVHFWGEVGKPGLHYIPVDSKLVKGLSFAGGGTSNADLEEIIVNRIESGKNNRREFDLKEGGSSEAHEFILHPGDTIFVERDTYLQDRAYYTSLIGVIATVISSIFIIKRIESLNK